MFEKLLVAHDGSDGAQKAFDAAIELASRLHATLHMISVEEDLPHYAETMLEADEEKAAEDTNFGQLAAQAKRRAALHSVALECTIVPGHEVKAIIDFAAEGEFYLLVEGFTGHSAVNEHVWGGTSSDADGSLRNRESLLVLGGAGSGKTTLLRAMAEEEDFIYLRYSKPCITCWSIWRALCYNPAASKGRPAFT